MAPGPDLERVWVSVEIEAVKRTLDAATHRHERWRRLACHPEFCCRPKRCVRLQHQKWCDRIRGVNEAFREFDEYVVDGAHSIVLLSASHECAENIVAGPIQETSKPVIAPSLGSSGLNLDAFLRADLHMSHVIIVDEVLPPATGKKAMGLLVSST